VKHWLSFSTAIAATVIALFLAPVRSADAEVIIVYGCSPGYLELGQGENMTCIPDPSWDSGGGGGPGWGGGADDPGWGGGGDPQETSRQKKCNSCREAGQKCLAQAENAEEICLNHARSMARYRCDIAGRGDGNTITPWGYSIPDLVSGAKTGEKFWDKARWDYTCGPSKGGGGSGKAGWSCWGPGVLNCEGSWAASHPAVTVTHTTTLQGSASFQGFGSTANETFTATSTWSSRVGFNTACTELGSKLASKCTSKQIRCENQYSCEAVP
jgi:hypothetical protein